MSGKQPPKWFRDYMASIGHEPLPPTVDIGHVRKRPPPPRRTKRRQTNPELLKAQIIWDPYLSAAENIARRDGIDPDLLRAQIVGKPAKKKSKKESFGDVEIPPVDPTTWDIALPPVNLPDDTDPALLRAQIINPEIPPSQREAIENGIDPDLLRAQITSSKDSKGSGIFSPIWKSLTYWAKYGKNWKKDSDRDKAELEKLRAAKKARGGKIKLEDVRDGLMGPIGWIRMGVRKKRQREIAKLKKELGQGWADKKSRKK